GSREQAHRVVVICCRYCEPYGCSFLWRDVRGDAGRFAFRDSIEAEPLMRRVNLLWALWVESHPAATAAQHLCMIVGPSRGGDQSAEPTRPPAKATRIRRSDIDAIEHCNCESATAIRPGGSAVLAHVKPAVVG